MKLAEVYSLGLGVPIGEPFLLPQFFPLDHPIEKVILLHASASKIDDQNRSISPAKVYDYYGEVVSMLNATLLEKGYKIFQIGDIKEPPIPGTVNLLGQTTLKQLAYLLKNCALKIGNDSGSSHIAAFYKTPTVTLFGSTNAANHGPFWYDKDKTVFLESHRFGEKWPSFASSEPDKTINTIPPEDVVNSSLKLLGFPEINHKSYFIGKHYPPTIFEIVPDTSLKPEFFPNLDIIIRMDYLHNENGLAANLQQRRASILADKMFNVDILRALRPNVMFVKIKISDEITPSFIKQIIRLGAPCSFYSDETDPRKLKEMKYRFMDAAVFDSAKDATVDDFWRQSDHYLNKKLDRDTNLANLKFRTNKFLVSSNGIFLNKVSWVQNKNKLENLSQNSQTIGDLAKEPDFWKELDHYYIYSDK